jgi:GGDEF domain-containing protein
VEAGIIHHFGCAHETVETQFRRGNQLICPKCAKTLRHIGLDYDKPGSVMVCQACGKSDDCATVGFVCLDCGAHRDSESMPRRDWHSYELTAQALQFLRSGLLTGAGDAERSLPQTFRLLLQHAAREEEHFGSPFSVMRIRFANAAALRNDNERLWIETIKMADEIVNGVVRPVDLASQYQDEFVVLLPRATQRDAQAMAAEIARRLRNALHLDPGTLTEILQPSEVKRLLDSSE